MKLVGGVGSKFVFPNVCVVCVMVMQTAVVMATCYSLQSSSRIRPVGPPADHRCSIVCNATLHSQEVLREMLDSAHMVFRRESPEEVRCVLRTNITLEEVRCM